VSQRVKDGTLKPLTDPETGRRYLDLEAADLAWDQCTDPSKAMAADADPETRTNHQLAYGIARAKREHFKALQEEASYLVRMGELVQAADVERQAFEDGRALRAAVLGVPDRIAPQLAAETDANRIHAVLTAELALALQALDRLPPPAAATEEGEAS
jgi:hypothetical protein